MALALALVLVIGLLPGNVFAGSHITEETDPIAFTVGEAGYWMGGTWVASDATPYVQADRIMVPVAHASRALGAAVTWKAETKEVEVTHHDDTYTLTIGSTQLQKNGELLEEMDTIPVIQNIGNGLGRTMLPVSRLAKVLSVTYTWDADTKTATFMPMAEEGPVVYDEAGTYGPEEDTETIDNDVIISADGVILQNLTISGTLTITQGVGDGDVTLNNITVAGDTLIQGGGTDSIHINGGSYGNIIVQRTPTGAVRVVVTGQNRLNIEVDEEADKQILILEGLYDKVMVTAPNVRIITPGDTQINELVITGAAKNITLETSDDTTIEKVRVDGEGTVFEGGEGTVKEVEGNEKDDLEDKDNVVVQPPTNTGRGGGGRRSSSNDNDEESVEADEEAAPAITKAEVSITSGSIVFGYTFYDGDEVVTYQTATQDPYYLDTSKAYVALINGENSVAKPLEAMNIRSDGTVVYEDLNEVIVSWWSNPQEAFVPAQIRIYLTPTDQGEWDAFEVVRDLTEDETSLFMPLVVEPPSEFAGGSGTEEDPYQVATAQHLDNVRNHLDKYFIQVQNIDLTGLEWEPIGEFSSGSQFVGSYDGNDKTINHLTIVPDANDQYVGLFGVIGYDGEAEIYAKLSNINLENVKISGTELHSVGALVGRANNYTTIDNCSASGEITATDNRGYAIGGLVGDNSATLTNSEANVTIYVSPTGTGSKAGGLAGHNGGHIDNCFATGDVTGNEYVGGLLGWHSNNPLTNSYSTGDVIGDESVGGLIGLAWGVTEKCFSTGNVSGNSVVGGLIGNLPGYARNVYAAGSASGGGDVGGLVGFYSGGGSPAEITNAYAYGQVSGASNTGGLVGKIWENSAPAPITASYWDTETTGKSNSVGGTGYVTSAMIKSTNSVPIYEDWDFDAIWTMKEGESYPYFKWQNDENIPYPPSPFAGGSGTSEDPYQVATAEQLNEVRNYLDKHFIQTANIDLDVAPWNEGEGWKPIGSQSDTFRGSYNGNEWTISNLKINAPSVSMDSGLFGYLGNSGVISSCSVTGIVNGNEQTGLLVGRNNGHIINSSAIGEVSGTYTVGGLVGSNITFGVITGSYAEVKVSGSGDYVGGFAGLNAGKIEECYSKGEVQGIKRVGGLVGANTGAIDESFSSGQVTGATTTSDTDSGGLVGVNSGSIQNSYSLGNVDGYRFVGGLVGRNRDGIDGNISNSYSTGTVTGTAGVGGLIGYNPGTVTSSYWDTVSSDISTSAGGVSKTTEEMKQMSTYTNWDFPDPWTINSSDNGGYPALAWQGFNHNPEVQQTVTLYVYSSISDVTTDYTVVGGNSLNSNATGGTAYQLDSGPSLGTLTFNSNGSFTYQPHAGNYGLDQFSYQYRDQTTDPWSEPVYVTVLVTDESGRVPINNAGVILNSGDAAIEGNTNAQGFVTFDLLSGTYPYEVSASAHNTYENEIIVGDESVDLDIELEYQER